SKVLYDVHAEDMLVDRLQAALNGFGGPNCNNIRAGLAGSQCEWFNPFSTAIQRNIYTGAGNPNYVASLANSKDLVKWLYVPINLHRDYGLYVFDGLISGDTGWQMPGGPIAVAVGTQFRYTQERFEIDDYSNIAVNPCATVGVTDCVNRTGPLVF